MTSHMTYAEAMVVGLVQGVTELFPVSSLGHNVLIPALIGGSWAQDLSVSAPESPYLAFIVGLHVATAAGMILYFWRAVWPPPAAAIPAAGPHRPRRPRSSHRLEYDHGNSDYHGNLVRVGRSLFPPGSKFP